jgi:hypothetical protein
MPGMNNLTASEASLTQLDSTTAKDKERRLDRRGILQFGGAAALAGAAAAVMGASPAGATTDFMQYGANNAAGTSPTGLTSSTATFSLRVKNGGSGHAIVGEATSADGSGSGVVGTGVGGAGVVGGTKGDGPGVRAYVQPGGKGPALQAVTLESSNSAPTITVFQAGTGHGLYSLIANETSDSRAVYGRTEGTGHAVLASVVNPKSSAAALKAATQGTGPAIDAVSVAGVGAIFRGKTAQVQLIPSARASHPTEGSSGQLFVDAAHRLWFCQGGTDWHRLA